MLGQEHPERGLTLKISHTSIVSSELAQKINKFTCSMGVDPIGLLSMKVKMTDIQGRNTSFEDMTYF